MYLNFSYSCLYVHLSALFNIDTSTPPSITFKYESFLGNVSAILDKYNSFLLNRSDIKLRRSAYDSVLNKSFNCFGASSDGMSRR